MEKYLPIHNNQTVEVELIPVLSYELFREVNAGLVLDDPENRHCVQYFGMRQHNKVKLFCCIADDKTQMINVSSTIVNETDTLHALTDSHLSFHNFEREIHENFGIQFVNHPWLKPLRYPFNRADKSKTIANYPFFSIDSEELHEVGVGPIHAGVIEPGHFRFTCNGEQILHLEIQLGYQHRGVEQLMVQNKKLLQRATLAEGVAGDTAVGHSVAFANVWESLYNFKPSPDIEFSRTLALELERMAIHTGDLSAICTDIAYQLGSAVYGRLRTPLVNFFQEWGGNRLAKGLIRPFRNQFPFTPKLGERLTTILNEFEPDFNEMSAELFRLPSALSRLERTGTVTFDEVIAIGTVGMSARMSGLCRDIRVSHPFYYYNTLNHKPIIKHHGDVYSRTQIRREEVWQSMGYVRQLISQIPSEITENSGSVHQAKPDAFCLSMVEGWRGEISHCAITDEQGELVLYKIKDPSFHNWLALALAVRNNEISDFPICNKSFNLSYCGFDL